MAPGTAKSRASGPFGAAAAGVLAALTLACAVSTSMPLTAPLSTALPAILPVEAVRQGWERIDGEYQTPREHVRYSLFVDPEAPLLYRITQYRVSLRVPGGDGSRLGYAWETVIWNEHPGHRVPLRCFTEDRRRTWQSLWLAPRSSWRDVDPSTSEFRAHMRRALEIYIRVHNDGRAGPPVGRNVSERANGLARPHS